jgi:predicted nucleic acid-binding protein
MLVVYSLLRDHPAADACEALLKSREAWRSSVLVQIEAHAVLVKAYSVAAETVDTGLNRLAKRVDFAELSSEALMKARVLAAASSLDLTDAVLLHRCLTEGINVLATDDRKLQRAAAERGLQIVTPLDDALRLRISEWEVEHLPTRGIARILGAVQRWLEARDGKIADEFRNATGAGSHLP